MIARLVHALRRNTKWRRMALHDTHACAVVAYLVLLLLLLIDRLALRRLLLVLLWLALRVHRLSLRRLALIFKKKKKKKESQHVTLVLCVASTGD
jgi:hypothetical protein